MAAVLQDVGAARDQAVRDALRRAVEQAAGVVIESRTLMVDFVVVEDRVRGRAQGFVLSYQVLEEQREDDVYRVHIRAEVAADLLEDDLEGFGAILRTSLGNPRILILPSSGGASVQIADAFTRHLVDRGFFVVDARQAVAGVTGDGHRDAGALADLARTLDVELIVDADSVSDVVVVYETTRSTFYRASVSVSLRAVLASTAQIVATASESREVVSSVSAVAVSRASDEALERVLGGFTLAIVSALNTSASDGGTLASMRVSVEGVPDFDTFQRLHALLGTVRGVSDVQARRLERGEATFDVQGVASIIDVATALSSSTQPALEVLSLAERTLRLRVR